MLTTIEQIATVVSIYQDPPEQPGCGRNCLCSCCSPGAKLPVYIFCQNHALKEQRGTGPRICLDTDPDSSGSEGEIKGFLDSLLLAKWEERLTRGLFRYDVTTCETRVLPGELGFVAQLNEGRHLKKRPTEFRVDQVCQAFDPKKFNFSKVGQEEVLFCFEASRTGSYGYFEEMIIGGSPNVIVINVSPIEYGHVLLVPKVLDCKPQQIDEESFRLALSMASEAQNPSFRVGYNSLGAFATINHLHFQAYYLAVPFPVERAAVTKLANAREAGGLKVFELTNFPVKGLVYEGGTSLHELADSVARACIALQERNIPFNVLIADCGQRIFLFPQCFAEKQALGQIDREILDTQVNPAAWEISGHIVLKRKQDYESATEESAWRLLAEVSLPEDRFISVKQFCLAAAQKEWDVTELHQLHVAGRPSEQIKKKSAAKIGSLKYSRGSAEICRNFHGEECSV